VCLEANGRGDLAADWDAWTFAAAAHPVVQPGSPHLHLSLTLEHHLHNICYSAQHFLSMSLLMLLFSTDTVADTVAPGTAAPRNNSPALKHRLRFNIPQPQGQSFALHAAPLPLCHWMS
jgi:hypothetical protein